jgi:hypothetical protein
VGSPATSQTLSTWHGHSLKLIQVEPSWAKFKLIQVEPSWAKFKLIQVEPAEFKLSGLHCAGDGQRRPLRPGGVRAAGPGATDGLSPGVTPGSDSDLRMANWRQQGFASVCVGCKLV